MNRKSFIVNEENFTCAGVRLLHSFLALFSVAMLIAVASSCRNPGVDLRSMAPAESLAYLEAEDLGKALRTITQNESFRKQAHSAIDPDNFDGIQVAVAVTGFETSEKEVTDGQSILNLRPKFTVIAETNAWSWQVRAIVERGLDGFIRRVYGEDAILEQLTKGSAEWYVWSAGDGRKSFAVISGTNIFFGNDEKAVESCLMAKSGTVDSLLKNEEVEKSRRESGESFAFGFVSKEGIQKIADVFGISVAVAQADSEDGRGIISRILPQLLKNGVEGVVWSAMPGKLGFEERILIKTDSETAGILNETVQASNGELIQVFELIPLNTRTVTRYRLRNPQVAFRSLFLVTAGKVSPIDGKLIAAFSNSLLSPYGITDAEGFLSAVDSEILTAQLDEDGDETFVVVRIKDLSKVKAALVGSIDFSTGPKELYGAKVWNSEDHNYAAALFEELLILGESNSVAKALQSRNMRKISPVDPRLDFTKSKSFERVRASDSVSVTISRDFETVKRLVRVLAKPKNRDRIANSFTVTETRFTKRGIERSYVSDFGLIGTIISQFDSD